MGFLQCQSWRGGQAHWMENSPSLGEEEEPAVDRTLEKFGFCSAACAAAGILCGK